MAHNHDSFERFKALHSRDKERDPSDNKNKTAGCVKRLLPLPQMYQALVIYCCVFIHCGPITRRELRCIVSLKLSDYSCSLPNDPIILSVCLKATWTLRLSTCSPSSSAPIWPRGRNPRLDITSKNLKGQWRFVHHSRVKQTGKGGGIKMKLACRFISSAVRIKGLPAPRLHRQPTACMLCFCSF